MPRTQRLPSNNKDRDDPTSQSLRAAGKLPIRHVLNSPEISPGPTPGPSTSSEAQITGFISQSQPWSAVRNAPNDTRGELVDQARIAEFNEALRRIQDYSTEYKELCRVVYARAPGKYDMI